jgi:hypothetical protein
MQVNAPDDAEERQAERIAAQAMRAPGLPRPHVGPIGSRQDLMAPSAVRETLQSPGQPLDFVTRSFMESRFGHDFSQVRVHSDPRSGEAAAAVHARAFTSNSDIVFGAGEYSPHSSSGRQLLAHELTHVIQQRTGPRSNMIQRKEKASAQMALPPSLLSGDFWIQDQTGNWFYCEFSCLLVSTTPVDNVGVGGYTSPAQGKISQTVSYSLISLEEYTAREKKRQQAFTDKEMKEFTRPKGGMIKPIYLEFDLAFLWRAPAPQIAKLFSAAGIAADILNGDYEGGLAETIKDELLGSLIKLALTKGWQKVYKIPPDKSAAEKIGIATEIIKLSPKIKTDSSPPNKKDPSPDFKDFHPTWQTPIR